MSRAGAARRDRVALRAHGDRPDCAEEQATACASATRELHASVQDQLALISAGLANVAEMIVPVEPTGAVRLRTAARTLDLIRERQLPDLSARACPAQGGAPAAHDLLPPPRRRRRHAVAP